MPYRTLLCLVALLGAVPVTTAPGQGPMLVWPKFSYTTPRAPYGTFHLTNASPVPVSVRMYARYGVIESDSVGEHTGVTLDAAGLLGDLTSQVSLFPRRVSLAPGERFAVRYGVWAAETPPERAHTTLIHFWATYDTAPQHPVGAVVPVTLIDPAAAPTLRAKVLAASSDTLSLLLINTSPHPFAGEVAVIDGGERLGSEAAAVFTRLRVDVPIYAMPAAKMVTLVFSSDKLPSPPPPPVQLFFHH